MFIDLATSYGFMCMTMPPRFSVLPLSALLLVLPADVRRDAGAASNGQARPTGPRANAAATQAPAPGRRLAFVIGINGSRFAPLIGLPHAEADARLMYKLLIHPELGAYRKPDVYLLLGAAATREAIARVFTHELIPTLRAGDSLVFYYAGYGVVDSAEMVETPAEPAAKPDRDDDDLADEPGRPAQPARPKTPPPPRTPGAYLLPVNADLARLDTDAIPLTELAGWLSKVRARRRLVLIDAGFSGALANVAGRNALAHDCLPSAKPDDSLLAPLTKLGPGAVVLCAASVGRPALDDPTSQHGLLTTCVCQGLAGRADMDVDGHVDARELLIYVAYQLATRAAELGVDQRAWEHGREAGLGFALGRVHHLLAPEAEPDARRKGRTPTRGFLWPTGARRPAAVQGERYYTDYPLSDDIKLALFDKARADEPVYAQIAPFDQDESRGIDEGFHVAKGGQILAVALARQLEKMGWSTGIELDAAMRERLQHTFPAVDVRPFRLRLRVAGSATFAVQHWREDGRFFTEARLDTWVRIHGQVGATEVGVFQKPVHAATRLAGDSEMGRGGRAMKVARQTLAKWVAAVLADPDLQPSLINYLHRALRN